MNSSHIGQPAGLKGSIFRAGNAILLEPSVAGDLHFYTCRYSHGLRTIIGRELNFTQFFGV